MYFILHLTQGTFFAKVSYRESVFSLLVFEVYLPTSISNLWELILSFVMFLLKSNLGCRSRYFSYSNIFLKVEYVLSLFPPPLFLLVVLFISFLHWNSNIYFILLIAVLVLFLAFPLHPWFSTMDERPKVLPRKCFKFDHQHDLLLAVSCKLHK